MWCDQILAQYLVGLNSEARVLILEEVRLKQVELWYPKFVIISYQIEADCWKLLQVLGSVEAAATPLSLPGGRYICKLLSNIVIIALSA